MRVHLEAAERQNGIAPEGLIGPDVPDLFAGVWKNYLEFQRGRGDGGFWSELEAWARLTRRRLSVDDAVLMVDIDRLVFQVKAEARK